MNSLNFSDNKDLKQEDLLKLYKDAKWLAYTNNPDLLQQAISNSLYVLTAWENGRLVGLIRLVGDGLTIVYIQDILVLKSHKRRKIGTSCSSRSQRFYRRKRLGLEYSRGVKLLFGNLGGTLCHCRSVCIGACVFRPFAPVFCS